MSKHTPGPWHTGTLPDNERSIFADEGRMRLENGATTLYPIAWTVDYDGEAAANARLIAAAPDLLAACRATLAHMYDDEIDAPTAAQLTEQLTRAIAKAEGGQL